MNDSTTPLEQFRGCLLGLALGDALGAPFEGGPLERLLWRVIGKTRDGKLRWTDDTQMSLDVAESLIAAKAIDQDDLARRFAAGYRWSRGYGPGTARVLRLVAKGRNWQTASRAIYPDGSFGNGGAMRAPVLGLSFGRSDEELRRAVEESTAITHAHPLGMDGAILIAFASAAAAAGAGASEILQRGAEACRTDEFRERLSEADLLLSSGDEPSPREVARHFGNRSTALGSCVTAVFLAARFLDKPFESLIDFITSCGGDADTIGAMAGAIWGASNGEERIPEGLVSMVESTQEIARTADRLHARFRL